MANLKFDAPIGSLPYDAYMEVADIPGESSDSKHVGWIEVKQYQHQVDQKIAASFSASGAPTAGQADHGFFWVCKEQDKATPKLFLSMCKGAAVKDVKLEFCTQAGEKTTFMKVVMKNCVVASIYTTGALMPPSGEAISISKPCEWVGFAYGEIEWTYTELDPETGSVKGDIVSHWSRKSNTGG